MIEAPIPNYLEEILGIKSLDPLLKKSLLLDRLHGIIPKKAAPKI
jgi:hypothetical protein